jgi:putative nucleotidyltransferase with HDIG domain
MVAALDRTAYLLAGVAAERTRVELEKILVSGRLQSALRLMQRTGALDAVMPEVGRTHGFCQATPYHAYDLFTHLVKTAAGTPPEVPLRLAGLLHDIGKVATQAAGPGRMVYYGHEQVSARDTVSIMQRLKFSKRAVDLVSFLVGNHMINYSRAWGDKAVRRFARKMGDRLEPVLVLAEADRRAQRPGSGREPFHLRERIARLRMESALVPELPVDGRDIMAILGLSEGPWVGRAKEFLSEEALKRGHSLSRDEAERLLLGWGASALTARP